MRCSTVKRMQTEMNRKPIELDATVELWLIPFNGQFSNQSIEAPSDAFALILLSLRILLKVVLKSIPHWLKLIGFKWIQFSLGNFTEITFI